MVALRGFVIYLLMTGTTSAQLVQANGTASVEVKLGMFSSTPSQEDIARAVKAARANLWKNYTARFSTVRFKQMEGRKFDVETHLDEFTSDVVVSDTEFDKATSTLRVAVRGNVNVTAVDRYFASLGTSAQEMNKVSAGNSLAFLFLARRVESIREFDARVAQVNEHTTNSHDTRQDHESAGQNGADAAEGTSTETSKVLTTKVETGGSTTRKSAQIKYQVHSSQDVDAAILDVMTSSGFEPATYEDVAANCNGPDPKDVRAEFVESDEMSLAVRKHVLDSAKQCDVRYLAIGTLDVGAPTVDAVTGNKKVFVSVRAQVMDLKPALPRRVASVGPIQFSGLGPDEQVATRNALDRAAREGAKTIVDQLNVRQIN
jgi:hypothetical protein